MALLLPPIPNDPIKESYVWREWFLRVYDTISNPPSSVKSKFSSRTYSYQVPTTGFNITIPSTIDTLVLNPAGTLATGTLVMPTSPSDGQVITVSSTQIITTLTVSPSAGHTILNAPTTLQGWITTPGTISGFGFSYIFILSTLTWVRLT